MYIVVYRVVLVIGCVICVSRQATLFGAGNDAEKLELPTKASSVGSLKGAGGALAVFSPDGRTIVTADYYSIRIWNQERCEPLSPLLRQSDHPGTSPVARFNATGTRIATAGYDECVRIWDANNGEHVADFKHGGFASDAIFSRDGGLCATASDDGLVRLWDVSTGVNIRSLKHRGRVQRVYWGPDATTLVSVSLLASRVESSSDGTIRLWDLKTGKALWEKETRGSVACCPAAISIDGEKLAFSTGQFGEVISICELKTGREVASFEAWDIAGPSEALAFSSDNKLIAVGSYGSASVWNAVTGRRVSPRLGHSSRGVGSVAFGAGDKTLLTCARTADDAIVLWDLSNGRRILSASDFAISRKDDFAVPLATAFGPGGAGIAIGDEISGVTHLWKVK